MKAFTRDGMSRKEKNNAARPVKKTASLTANNPPVSMAASPVKARRQRSQKTRIPGLPSSSIPRAEGQAFPVGTKSIFL